MKQIYDAERKISAERSEVWQNEDVLPAGLYDFQRKEPPMLTERMLQHRLEQQKAKRQALLVTTAGMLTQLLLMVAMILLYEYEPVLAMIGMVYVVLSVTGGMATAVIYTWKRRTV